MDTAWCIRIILFMTFAIIIFGDMLGYANVKGDKDSTNANHQRTVDATIKKTTHHHSNDLQNIDGKCR